MKPCIIGIILATGAFMTARYCAVIPDAFRPDIIPISLTAALAAIYFGSRKVMKNGISPIALIGISALAGVMVYGL